jgi:hypothetical protein
MYQRYSPKLYHEYSPTMYHPSSAKMRHFSEMANPINLLATNTAARRKDVRKKAEAHGYTRNDTASPRRTE